MTKMIKAILFDSGRVLNGPRTGHWFITPNFFKYIDKNSFDSIPSSQLKEAFSKASQYVSQQKLIVNLDEEFYHFREYYRILFDNLKSLNVGKKEVENVTMDLVYNTEKYKFYEDVYEEIPRLSKKYKLAVVSDAWPSLEKVFIEAGLREYFSSFVISSILGTNKPNELMYTTAIDELDVSTDEVVFIDDNLINCDGAKELGINSFLMCRDFKYYLYYKLIYKKYKVIRNLNKFENILNSLYRGEKDEQKYANRDYEKL